MIESNWPGLRTGQKTVAVSGTPEQLSSNLLIPSNITIKIKALLSNTGTITVGYTSATALHTGSGFYSLLPSESIELCVSNANLIWLDATVSGEGVEFIVEYDN